MTGNDGEQAGGAAPAWLKVTLTGAPGELEAASMTLLDLGAGGLEEGEGSVAAYFKPDRKEAVDAALGAGQKVSHHWDTIDE